MSSLNILEDEELDLVMDLLKNRDISGWFKSHDGGEYLQEFQRLFASFCGANYAFAVSSGSASIYIALKAVGVGLGDYVAVPAYTHIGSVAPICLAGAKPIFVDVTSCGNLDPIDLKQVMSGNKPIKAVIVVHQLGVPCEMEAIKSVSCNAHIIEDASHALGSEYNGKKAGVLGHIGCFSIGGGRTKTISTGEGGMVTTNDEAFAQNIKNIRNHGDRYTDAPYLCFNFRMSELQALIGLLQMRNIEKLNKWQVENGNYIIQNLPETLEYIQPPSYMKSINYLIGTYFKSNISKISRNDFLDLVRKQGLEGGIPRRNIGPGYSKLIYEVEYFKQFKRKCKNSENLRDSAVWIDWHRYPRTKEEIDQMLNGLKGIIP